MKIAAFSAGTAIVIGLLLWVSLRSYIQPQPQLPQMIKVMTTQVLGGQNGGVIDVWEYRTNGMICMSQILVVPGVQTFTNITTNCVAD